MAINTLVDPRKQAKARVDCCERKMVIWPPSAGNCRCFFSQGSGMFRLSLLLAVTSVLSIGNSHAGAGKTDPGVQTLNYGGDIVTMEGDEPTYVEAVMERGGRIIYAGPRVSAVNNFAGETIEVDLQGKTLMPGFIEPHAHPVSIGAFILANDIVAPHEWRMPHKTYPGVSGKENYLKAVKAIIDSKKDKSQTVLIWGYHKS